MSAILDKARAHFERMSSRRAIEVPEWGEPGEPAILYVPGLSLANRQAIERRSKNDPVNRLISTVIMFTQNEDGTRAFADDAATRRMFETEIAPEVIARLANAILGVSDETDLGE